MKSDGNWWRFSLDPAERNRKIENGADTFEVNPPQTDGRKLIDYSSYLGLDNLLASSFPASETPDERIFITTHHLFEITFKQMIFDLAVTAETLETVAEAADDDEFLTLCLSETEREEFWRPAILAANRLRYSAKTVLPALFHFLDKSEGKDETFSGAEYFKFRPFLPPASGFQSWQFRLMQRAFGKGKLFEIRLFPSQEYSRDYEGRDSADLREITDKVFLREHFSSANPDAASPSAKAVNLDAAAHKVLERLAAFAALDVAAPPIRFIADGEIETAAAVFQRILIIHRKDQEAIGEKPADADAFDSQAVINFRRDLAGVVNFENARRANLSAARDGAFYLHSAAPKSALMHILSRLVSADAALFGGQEDSFLSLHLRMAADRIREVQEAARAADAPEQPAGTGGGGVPYLINVKNNLIALFPMLIAFRDLENAPVLN